MLMILTSRNDSGIIFLFVAWVVLLVSQCCLPKHASRPNKQYLENVAVKINVKVSISILFM